ncbi:MAG: hypothetical protein HC927_01025, partial [Deltaproteobacteria bacterium]|nr:hypothetical protein [Deltaproteobacteria bacterium]
VDGTMCLRLSPPGATRSKLSEETLAARWEGDDREELERIVAGIAAALDARLPIEERGSFAVFAWSERSRARLVREDGEWKIEDPD